MTMTNNANRIYAAGHRGMVGSAIARQLLAAGHALDNIITRTYDQHTRPMQSHINVGYGSDITIAQLAQTVGQVVGYQGTIDFDASKPDGAPRKLMDSSRLSSLGWQAKVSLQVGLTLAIKIF